MRGASSFRVFAVDFGLVSRTSRPLSSSDTTFDPEYPLNNSPGRYQLLIVGGGISGAALLYTVARYTGLTRVALLDKAPRVAAVNSATSHNSQTLHAGDIETNYSLEKALSVKRSVDMIVNFARAQEGAERLIFKYPKMVLGVGDEECALLRRRFETFAPHYAGLRLLEAADIAQAEPRVALVDGAPRPEPIVALGSADTWSAADFAALARVFVRAASTQPDKTVDVRLNTRALNIERRLDGFYVDTPQGVLAADAVVVCAGAHSLPLAQGMGYGTRCSVLPVAGNFYLGGRILNGKVYTVQNDKLPFAAIHGDPDIAAGERTRFGPTANLVPMLERHDWRSIPEFLRVLGPDRALLAVLGGLLAVGDIRRYMLMNVCYEIPLLGRYLFLRSARKIVPSLRFGDIEPARGFGGLRPQLIDKDKRVLMLGEAKIPADDGLIFNVTPSPGATSCLANARIDARTVCGWLNLAFDEQRFADELER